ncbi:MAG: amidohydrolase family protein [Gemmatimonadaceae bacterium]
MIPKKWTTLCVVFFNILSAAPALVAQSEVRPIALVAQTLYDGKGNTLHDVNVIIRGSVISQVGGEIPAEAIVYNLTGLTVTPGWIDTHSHILWHFDNGRLAGNGEPPMQAILYGVDNAILTLDAGFTTIQSPGSPNDAYLRDAINRGIIPGPRIRTSLQPLTEKSGTPDQLRALVDERKQQGADFIKIFASQSIREGGAQTMTDAQLQAACGEANRIGMRTMIHAHSAAAAKAATLAGCTSVEHGAYVTDDVFKLMAERGTFYDPNIGLVLQNYLLNKDKFMGIGNYNAEGFAFMEKGEAITLATFKRALKIKGLKIDYGTDAVAGAHGRNGEEYIARVQHGGEDPMAGIVSATYVSAQSMGMQDQIGSISPGLQADIIAMDGDPLKDATSIQRVVFVMKGGTVFKNLASSAVTVSNVSRRPTVPR